LKEDRRSPTWERNDEKKKKRQSRGLVRRIEKERSIDPVVGR